MANPRKRVTKRKPAKKVRTAAAKSRQRTPDFAEWPEWSEAKFFAFLRSGLRAKWQRFPSRYAVLAAAKRPYKGPNKQQKWEFQCAQCKGWFLQRQVSVDHIVPAGSLKSFEDLVEFARKLFVGTAKLQVLCNDNCHREKTAADKLQGETND